MLDREYITYAQNREDLIIQAFFVEKQKGFYIDIGANHPKEHSVTKLFYDMGWRGINIEPEPKMFKLLEQNRHGDINLKIGLSDKPGKLSMRQYLGKRSGLSTFSEKMMQENSEIGEFVDVRTEVTTLDLLLSSQEIDHIDFMKIDVEGFEDKVLKGNNWKKFRPSLICVEANHVVNEWQNTLKKANYDEIFYDGLNKYYVAQEAKEVKNNFSFVNSVASLNIVNYRSAEKIQKLHRHTEQISADIDALKTENLRLQREIIDSKRIISLIKQFIKTSDAVIRRMIEKLNRPRNNKKRATKLIIDNSKNKKELHKRIRVYDLDSYYSNSYKKDRIAYRIMSNLYNGFSRLIFSAGKSILGLVRRGKHA